MTDAESPSRGPTASPDRPLRVLVAAHGHPSVSNGGAEIAAFRLFHELDAHPGVEAWFLGCNAQPGAGRDGVAITQPYGAREYLYSSTGHFDWFRFANADPRLPREFEALLRELRPDIVHLHHYANLGVEALLIIRRTLPSARIVLTLHEFQAICNHFGQMVKRGDFALCDRADPSACHKCFPAVDASDFFLRKRYIKLFLDYVDHFIAPSHFLLRRYAEWGIDEGRLSMIENIVTSAAASSAASRQAEAGADESGASLRIGFFGQISKLKGIDVLLDCAELISRRPEARIAFEIHGDYTGQPPEFREAFLARLEKLPRNVTYRGVYRQEQVDALMRDVDAVVTPSIWWENSPVVIQEALRNRRPVICSGIGGMAEKVRDGLDGFRLQADPTLLRGVGETLRPPVAVTEVLSAHLAVYGRHDRAAGPSGVSG
jgi:glycosyltransferase involved in cell wall biosynthesis